MLVSLAMLVSFMPAFMSTFVARLSAGITVLSAVMFKSALAILFSSLFLPQAASAARPAASPSNFKVFIFHSPALCSPRPSVWEDQKVPRFGAPDKEKARAALGASRLRFLVGFVRLSGRARASA